MNTQNEALEKLKQHSSIIAILEIASLLHDIGKCDNRFPKEKMQDKEKRYNHRTILEEEKERQLINDNGLADFFEKDITTVCKESLASGIIDKLELKQIAIKNFVKEHEELTPKRKLIAFVAIADKKDSSDDRNMPLAKQAKKTYVSTIFGKEAEIKELDVLRVELYKELSRAWQEYEYHNDTKQFREKVFSAFEKLGEVLAETRRAANDVSLWDHSYATASIMKALLYGDALTDFSTKLDDLPRTNNHWNVKLKVLGIGWNANKFLAESQSLPGLIGRKKLIVQFKRELKELLEYEYPVGNVIYEDQDALCFLVSDKIGDKIDDPILCCLKEKIIEKVNGLTDGSLSPIVELSKPDAYPNKIITQVITNLKKRIDVPLQVQSKPQWTSQWEKDKSDRSEVCAQCGKRPILKDEELCDFCLKLTRKGAEPTKKPNADTKGYQESVWIDEIADEKGNVALIYSVIPLTEWLNGARLKTLQVKTIRDVGNYPQKSVGMSKDDTRIEKFFGNYQELVGEIQTFEESLKNNNTENSRKILCPFLNFWPNKWETWDLQRKEKFLDGIYQGLTHRAESEDPARILEVLMTKSASPSRMRKIWMETQAFFEELSAVTQGAVRSEMGDYCLRLRFKPKFLNADDERLLESINSGILEVEKFNSETKLPKSDLFWDGEYAHTTIRLEHYALSGGSNKKPKGIVLKEKQEYIKRIIEKLAASSGTFVTAKNKKNKEGKIHIAIDSYSFEQYIPTRTILTSPNLFATLVPAELALNLLQNEYLPKYQECFGKVADRLPLNVGILFFKRKFPLYIAMDVMGRLAGNLLSLSSKSRAFKVTKYKSTKLSLEEVNEEKQKLLCTEDSWLVKYMWAVNDKLGDNSEDLYYPNFIVEVNTPEIRKKESYFELSDVGSTLNIKDIDAGMALKIYPSLFDFHFLGSSGERFHLFLDNEKRSHPLLDSFGMRPYLLKDLEKMNVLWDSINPEKGKLSKSQIKKLEYFCITKIEDWFQTGHELTTNPATDETYKKFVESSVNDICKDKLSSEERKRLVEAILSGMFFDVVELFLTLKSYNREVE